MLLTLLQLTNIRIIYPYMGLLPDSELIWKQTDLHDTGSIFDICPFDSNNLG